MPVSVTLPALGESVTEGTVTRWLKQVGDTVQADEPLLEVSTDKVDTEIPAPASGVLTQITVGEDETVAVGAELAVISEESSQDASAPAQEPQAPAEEPEPQQAQQPQQAEQAQQPQQDQQPQQQAQPEPQQQAPAPAAEEQQQAPSAGDGEGTSVTLPALGESVTEGTVTRWLKQVGDTVQADEPLLEVSTDKVDTEIPAPASGTLVRITVGEDETVQVGAELGVIASEASAAPAAAPRHAAPPPAEESAPQQQPQQQQPQQQPQQPAPQRQPQPQQQPAQAQTQTATVPPQVTPSSSAPVTSSRTNGDGAGAQYVTPLVRKLASEHNIDLSTINGTGVGGRIRKQDVLEAAKARDAAQAQQQAPAQAAEAPAPSAEVEPSPLRGTTEKLSRMRRIIAERMVEALQTAAQLTTVVEVDVTAIARVRDKVKNSFLQREGVKLSFLPFFAKATVDALKEHPKLNASIDTEKSEITYHDAENLIIAVDTERGLMVPVIHNAGDLSVAGLAKKIADIAERTRTNKITPDELYGGTFTITNTGSRGALFDTPIFTPPQVAMLGTGTVVKRPVVIDTPQGETIAIRHMVYLALSYDHRLIDGADAARFLTSVKKRLEDGSVAAEFN